MVFTSSHGQKPIGQNHRHKGRIIILSSQPLVTKHGASYLLQNSTQNQIMTLRHRYQPQPTATWTGRLCVATFASIILMESFLFKLSIPSWF